MNTIERLMMLSSDEAIVDAWGAGGNSGELNGSPLLYASSPVQISSMTGTWSQVSFNYNRFLAIKTDGTLWAWGLNTSGQLGDNTNISKSSPVQIGGDSNWSQISAGPSHCLAVKTTGTLWTWGYNNNGRLGDNSVVTKSSPTQIGTATDWSKVYASVDHSLAVKTTGTLWAWGVNTNGQLGDNTIVDKSSPVQIGTATDWSQISAGIYHSLAIKTTGTLWAWGYNLAGQLGDSTQVDKSSPIQIGTDSTWSKISGSRSTNSLANFSVAIKTDGSLWSWGFNDYGQLGTGTVVNRSSPVQIGAGSTWIEAHAGYSNSIFIKNDNTVWQAGASVKWLSDWSTVDSWYTTKFLPNSYSEYQTTAYAYSSLVQIASGVKNLSYNDYIYFTQDMFGDPYYSHTKIVSIDTTDKLSQIGYKIDLSSNPLITTTLTKVIDKSNVKDFAIGNNSTIVILKDGKMYSFGDKLHDPFYYTTLGYNDNKIFGLGSDIGSNFVPSSPKQIGSLSTWDKICINGSIGTPQSYTFALALKTDNTLWSWGRNSSGQLGISSIANTNLPTQIGGNSNWSQISAGITHSLAIKSDSTLWSWGDNFYGQLGINTSVSRSSPVQIGTDTDWSSITAGDQFTIAIRNTGTLWSWGYNFYGTLGDNTTVVKSSPIQVGSDNTWNKISSRYRHVLAIKNNGTLWAWGLNTSGQLGNSSAVTCSSPVQIGGDSNWSQVAAGYSASLALKTNGTLWAWGGNTTEGILGLGDSINRSSPVQVGTNINFTKIKEFSNTHVFVLKTP